MISNRNRMGYAAYSLLSFSSLGSMIHSSTEGGEPGDGPDAGGDEGGEPDETPPDEGGED